MSEPDHDFTGLKATFVNCTLKRSPEPSHTQGLVDASAGIMRKHGVEVSELRLIDHDVATGVYPDMREHGWENDAWPDLYPGILASDILVVAGPIWLGDNSSVTKQLIERIYSLSGELNDKGQYLFYGRVAGCLITGNEDGIKHCAQNVLYSLQHVGYTIPPERRRRLDRRGRPRAVVPRPGQRRAGERLHQPQHHVHDVEPHAPGQDAEGRRRRARLRQPALGVERRDPLRLREPGVSLSGRYCRRVAGDESALVAALRAGDEAAFARLVNDWSRSMLMLARGFVSTEASAEEVVQETWLAVLKGLDRFEGRSSLRTWVYRILVNTAKSRGVREHRTLPWSSLGGEDAGPSLDPALFQSAATRTPAAGGPHRRRGPPRSRSRGRCWPARYAASFAPSSTSCPTGNGWC